jgi:hypothetical protein
MLDRAGRWLDCLLVGIAIGHQLDSDWWEPQLATLPHELAHIGQWAEIYGEQTPWEVVKQDIDSGAVGLPSLSPWRRHDGEAEAEKIARILTPAFIDIHPEFECPACPVGCPCSG